MLDVCPFAPQRPDDNREGVPFRMRALRDRL
jgi:hypothetical protein